MMATTIEGSQEIPDWKIYLDQKVEKDTEKIKEAFEPASPSDMNIYDAIAENYNKQLKLPSWPIAQQFLSPQDVILVLELAKTGRIQNHTHAAACWIAAHWLSEIMKEKTNAST
jgi:hypothetical protein